jgi:hypothetical protein
MESTINYQNSQTIELDRHRGQPTPIHPPRQRGNSRTDGNEGVPCDAEVRISASSLPCWPPNVRLHVLLPFFSFVAGGFHCFLW